MNPISPPLIDKVALVTGASSGIGRAIALRLARDGAFVWVNYNTRAEEAEDVVIKVRAKGGKAESVQADVGEVGQIRAMFDKIDASGQVVDILVNNSGICPFLQWDEIGESDWDRTHAINLKGCFFATQEAAKRMVARGGGGRILAVSSISALKGGTVQAHYCPTKGGMISMMAAFAVSLGKHRITCNSLLPGTIETAINQEYLATPGNREPLEKSTCVGFIGMPEDCAGIASFLCRDEAHYITGAQILIDGGEMVQHL
jgi:L-rhamnose 1-dehydrogenase